MSPRRRENVIYSTSHLPSPPSTPFSGSCPLTAQYHTPYHLRLHVSNLTHLRLRICQTCGLHAWCTRDKLQLIPTICGNCNSRKCTAAEYVLRPKCWACDELGNGYLQWHPEGIMSCWSCNMAFDGSEVWVWSQRDALTSWKSVVVDMDELEKGWREANRSVWWRGHNGTRKSRKPGKGEANGEM